MRDRSLGLTSAGRSSRHVPAGMQGYSGVLTPSTLSAPAQGALGALKTWLPAQFEERGMSRRGTEHNPSKRRTWRARPVRALPVCLMSADGAGR